jgi:PAS domain S-box-containing protein
MDFNIEKDTHLNAVNPELSAIIDVPALQSLMEKFFAITHMGIGIIDLKGNVLVKVGWQDACTKFHRLNPESVKNCRESDTILTEGVQRGEFREYKCRNHIWDIVTPLFINDRHVGNLFFGQYFYTDETIDKKIFTAQAEQYGFDKEAYLAAIKNVQRFSREQVRNLMVFFTELANLISHLSYSNLKLAQTISDQKKVEQTLKESQEDLAHAQEVSHTGSWRLDLDNDNLLWSDETYRIFGISFGTPMTYEKFLSSVYPEDRDLVNQKWTAALSGAPYDVEHRIMANDEIRWVRERGELEFNQQGKFKSGFGTVHDITERKQDEEALKRYTRDLEEALKEIESFSYSVSHDLRQPLRALDGFSQAILEDYGDKLDDQGKDYLNRIRQASHLMSQLTDDMLKLSRVTRAEMDWGNVNLSEVAKTVVSELKSIHPGRLADFSITPDIIAYGDRQLLTILLKNLLENSWKFTAKKTRAEIKFGVSNQKGNRVCFVKDNGAGFDMRYADKLFKPFQRLHREADFPGTGIGLATVQRIIHRHGWNIWAESKLGKGTTIYFTCDPE